MSELKHPGPWKYGMTVYGTLDNDGIGFRDYPIGYEAAGYCDNPYIVDANGETVAGCDEYLVFNSKEAVALLLAAPDLYAVCAKRLAELEFLDDPTDAQRAERAELFALLQRARGE